MSVLLSVTHELCELRDVKTQTVIHGRQGVPVQMAVGSGVFTCGTGLEWPVYYTVVHVIATTS